MGLVISAVYSSNLKAMIIIPKLILPFNSMEEMLQTDIASFAFKGSLMHELMEVKSPRIDNNCNSLLLSYNKYISNIFVISL